MNRRHFLAVGGVGIGTVGGYVGWRRYNSPSLPDGMSVETRHFESDVLSENSARDSEILEWREEYHRILANTEAVNREIVDTGPVTAFLTDTDFEESYLVVVQNGMQSEMELVLDAISRRTGGLDLDISIDSPQGGPDDLLIHSLLVRMTDEKRGVPEELSVDIDGYV